MSRWFSRRPKSLTIRQFLMRRSEQYSSRVVIFVLASGTLVTFAFRNFALRFACAVVIAVVVTAAFWSLFQIPCPKCRNPLGMIGFKTANSGLASRQKPARCPHCEVNFDEPMPVKDDLAS